MKQFCILFWLPWLASSSTPQLPNEWKLDYAMKETDGLHSLIASTIKKDLTGPVKVQHKHSFGLQWDKYKEAANKYSDPSIQYDKLYNNDASGYKMANRNFEKFRRPAVMEGGLLSAQVPQHTLIAIDRYMKILKSLAGFAIALSIGMPFIHEAASAFVHHML